MVPIRQSRRLILILALLAAPALQAEAPLSAERAADLRTRFEAKQRKTRTWSASFTQTLAISGIVRPVVSEGTIRFRAPDQLRIDFSKPAGEFVLAVGDRLFLQKPGKALAVRPLRKDSAGKPILALLGLLCGQPGEDEANFDASVSRDDARYVIMLTRKPNVGGNVPRRITNTVSAATLDVRETLVELPGGGTLTYVFGEAKRNQSLPAALFEPPVAR